MNQNVQNNQIWWYESNGKQLGPLNMKEIVALYKINSITKETLLWKQGMENWTPISFIPEFTMELSATNSVNNINKGFDAVLENIDNGNIFKQAFYIIYKINAFCAIAVFLLIFYKLIEENLFKYLEGFDFLLLLITIIGFAIVFFIIFMIWNKRSNLVKNINYIDNRFSATPTISHFIQTSGECACAFFTGGGLILFFISILSSLSESSKVDRLFKIFDFGMGVILGLLIIITLGFILLLISRLIAESIRALSVIAINTNKNLS